MLPVVHAIAVEAMALAAAATAHQPAYTIKTSR